MPKLSKLIQHRRLRKLKDAGKLKFSTRYYNRCGRCGRARGYYRRFDLCPECHLRFLEDPLGRDALSRLKFSEN